MPKKTREDVEKLKREWKKDPCFDLHDADGFTDFRQELFHFEKEQIALWATKAIDKESEFLESASYVNIMLSMYQDEKDLTTMVDLQTQALIQASHLQTKALLMIAEQLERLNDRADNTAQLNTPY